MGHKRYELTNHLGNVMATITDRRLQAVTHDSVVTAFDAEVVNAQDYNSFGSIMEGRQLSTADSALYRYGFNGKENDNDIGKGIGGEQDYGMRIYDSRLGRFLSLDPITAKYPELTPYQFASNSPIKAVDLDGLEAAEVTVSGRGTFLLVSAAANVSVVAASNGISLYLTPELGLGTGVSISGGVSAQFFPTVKSSEQLGGWGFNAGGSLMGNGIDISGSIQQNSKTGNVEGVKLGAGGAVPKVGGGAGAEAHLTASYSFLVGTVSWNDIGDGISKLANVAGFDPDKLKKIVESEKKYLDAQSKNSKNQTPGKPSKMNDEKNNKEIKTWVGSIKFDKEH